jgi:methyl-accepting chemotaxis protein
LSGVPVGAVDQVYLQPDYTVDIIMAIKQGYEIPVGSRFLIQAPLTGEPSVIIAPPKDVSASVATLPHEVLPIDQQPKGVNPTTFADLIEEGQGEAKRLDKILAQIQSATPHLLAELQSTLQNSSDLTANANDSLHTITSRLVALSDSFSSSLTTASGNIVDLTATLKTAANKGSGQLDALFAQLQKTSHSFGESVDALHDIATDPTVKANLLQTAASFAQTAKTLAALSNDLRQVTGNPQTQAELRDTVTHLDASTQRLDSLLAQLGGTTTALGGATPAPGSAVPGSAVPGSAVPGAPATVPGPLVSPRASTGSAGVASTSGSNSAGVNALRAKLNDFTKDLVQLQVRVTSLAPERPGSANRNTSPLLTADRGLQTDFNALILPKNTTSLFAGVNDTGYAATGNFMLVTNHGGLHYGGGLEYSQLGTFASYTAGRVGLEGRLYDLRHPTLDSYLNLFAAPRLQIFGGGRDLTHTDRRAVFGFQFEI